MDCSTAMATMINGEPYFIGKDVAEILGYADPNKFIAMHVDEDDKLNDKSASSLGQRGGWFINESGLYSLILSSKLLPVTGVVTGLGTAAVKTAADFDSAMSKVAAVSGFLALLAAVLGPVLTIIGKTLSAIGTIMTWAPEACRCDPDGKFYVEGDIGRWYNGSVKLKFNAWGKIMEFLDSEMMKRFMHSAPVNIFFKDTECRYCFASEICDLVSVGENGSIVGKTDLEVQKFPEMGKMYYEDDKKILETGEGSQYINEFPMEDGESLYFEIKKNAVRMKTVISSES